MTLRRAWWLAAFALAPLTWLACNALAGIDEPVVNGPVCAHLHPPLPPKGADTGDGGISFAFHHVSFGDISGDTPKPAAPGYDLDEVCTCPGEPSCKPLLENYPACDYQGGADNGFLGLWATFAALIGMDGVNKSMQEGGFGFVLIVSGYNGQPDDPVVDVKLLAASTGHGLVDGGGPVWEGADLWNIDAVSYIDAGIPRTEDTAAYVAGGVLVSNLPTARMMFPISGRQLRVDVTDAVLTARLSVSDAGVYTMTEGQFAGRIPQESLLSAIAGLPLLQDPVLCGSPVAYESARTEVCKRADILRKSGSARAAPCDALSYVLGFDGVQANVGTLEVVPQLDAGPCPPGTRFDCVGIDF